MGDELERLRQRAAELARENEDLRQQLRDWQADDDAGAGPMAYPPAVMKGEVGTLPGVPIAGTNDVVNAGAARRPRRG
jgi:hypothetical protein